MMASTKCLVLPVTNIPNKYVLITYMARKFIPQRLCIFVGFVQHTMCVASSDTQPTGRLLREFEVLVAMVSKEGHQYLLL